MEAVTGNAPDLQPAAKSREISTLLLDGAVDGAILGGHHFLELAEVDTAVTVRIDGLDHVLALLDGALHPEAVQRKVEFRGGDETVLVAVVQIEGVAELGGAAVRCVGAAECGELREADEAVMVGVEVVHHATELLRRHAGSECPENAVQLVDGDLAVAVGVEAVEDSLEFFHVFEVWRG